MSKTISLQLDDELIAKAENILDDVGLDCLTFIKMCFKKLSKEQSISFLTTIGTAPVKQESNELLVPYQLSIDEDVINSPTRKTPNGISDEQFASSKWNIDEDIINYPIRRTKNVITAQMRDYIWNMFKSHCNSKNKIDCSYCAKLANTKTGITQGSAYIYFLILDNLVAGVPNTRTMKFDDLVIYLSYINEQLPKICISNAIKSLSESIPYWEEHIQGYFAQKVSKLVSQYKKDMQRLNSYGYI